MGQPAGFRGGSTLKTAGVFEKGHNLHQFRFGLLHACHIGKARLRFAASIAPRGTLAKREEAALGGCDASTHPPEEQAEQKQGSEGEEQRQPEGGAGTHGRHHVNGHMVRLHQRDQVGIAKGGHRGRKVGRLRAPILRGYRCFENPGDGVIADSNLLDVIDLHLREEARIAYRLVPGRLALERRLQPIHEQGQNSAPYSSGTRPVGGAVLPGGLADGDCLGSIRCSSYSPLSR